MCPAAGYAFFGGARGPRPTGQVRYPPVGDGVPDVPSARRCRAGRRIPTPVCGLARNDGSRGGRLCPPCMTAAPCRAGPVCPAVTGVRICDPKPSSAREVSARSADGGREATRFSLPQSAAPTAPSQRGPNSAAPPRCHCEARSAVAIRPPSTNLRQNHNNSLPNFVHLSKI